MFSDQPLLAIILIGALSLVPFVFVASTSFLKFSVVLSILRNALGTGQAPSGLVISSLAFVFSLYVMAPTFREGVAGAGPGMVKVLGGKSSADQTLSALKDAFEGFRGPFSSFFQRNSGPREKHLFHDLAKRRLADPTLTKDSITVALPAFMLTELREAFLVGFLIFLPFLVVDLVVANVLMALGMHMLSPTSISLPFKLLLFVAVDGWFLLTQNLVLGYR